MHEPRCSWCRLRAAHLTRPAPPPFWAAVFSWLPRKATPLSQLYELKITASGEVRDADGNLLSQEPIETTLVLTEDELATLITEGELG